MKSLLFRPATVILSIILTAMAATGLYFFYNNLGDGSYWDGLLPGNAAHGEYCESNHWNEIIRQPVNSWSNLFYFFLGSMIFFASVTKKDEISNPLIRLKGLGILFGLSMMVLCFSSFYYHASVIMDAQYWDMRGVYSTTNLLMLAALYRLYILKNGESAKARNGFFAGFGMLFIFFYFFTPLVDGKIVLPLLILFQTWLAGKMIKKLPGSYDITLLATGLALLFIAGACLFLDRGKVLCVEDSIFQLHSVWHLTSGLSAFFIYLFLVSEKGSLNDQN